jgi:MFS family permease
MYLPAPFLSLALQRWPFLRKPFIVSGLVITVIALLGASFCSTVPGLIGCQGILFAVGGILAYFPGMQIIDQWFVKRRATAFAFVWAAAPLAGAIIPFAMQWLLDNRGFRTALRVYAVTVVS